MVSSRTHTTALPLRWKGCIATDATAHGWRVLQDRMACVQGEASGASVANRSPQHQQCQHLPFITLGRCNPPCGGEVPPRSFHYGFVVSGSAALTLRCLRRGWLNHSFSAGVVFVGIKTREKSQHTPTVPGTCFSPRCHHLTSSSLASSRYLINRKSHL